MISHSGNGIVSDCNLKRAGGIEHAIRIVARLDRLHGGEDTSMVTPAMIRFLRPIFSIATSRFSSCSCHGSTNWGGRTTEIVFSEESVRSAHAQPVAPKAPKERMSALGH
jgi:hypothetical protein